MLQSSQRSSYRTKLILIPRNSIRAKRKKIAILTVSRVCQSTDVGVRCPFCRVVLNEYQFFIFEQLDAYKLLHVTKYVLCKLLSGYLTYHNIPDMKDIKKQTRKKIDDGNAI